MTGEQRLIAFVATVLTIGFVALVAQARSCDHASDLSRNADEQQKTRAKVACVDAGGEFDSVGNCWRGGK